MKNFKTPFLSALVFFGTLLVLSVGYAAWTMLDPTDADGGKVLSSTLLKSMINSINDIGTRTDGISSVGGNIGIGTASPNNKIDIKGNLEVGAGTRGAIINSTVSDNFNITTFNNTPNPNFSIGYGNGAGGTDLTKEYITANAGHISFINSNVGIGTTAPNAKLSIANNISAGGPAGIYGSYQLMLYDGGNANQSYGLGISNNTLWFNANALFDFYVAGTRVASIASNGAYSQLSDKRYKTNINTITSVLDKIKKLNGVSFNWKSNGKKDIGVIAQDVEKVFPEAVATDEKGMKSVAYGNLVAPLIEAVKELNSRTQEQLKQIEELKDENNKIKEEMNILKSK